MIPRTRREFLKDATLLGAGITTCTLAEHDLLAAALPSDQPASPAPSAPSAVSLSWLGEKPPSSPTGVSWGVPWPQGAVKRDLNFSLNADGKDLPLQSWPLAYWPDGSIKWSGFATVVPAGLAGPVTLSTASASASAASGALTVKNDGKSIVVDTGAIQCSIPLNGSGIINSISIVGKDIAAAGQLVCILQNGPATTPEISPAREKYLSDVKHVTVEQSGLVRAVVRIEGVHRGEVSKREWLPFTVRLYCYSGQTAVRVVHTIVFDGDQEKDFVRGLGLQFDVPMRDEPHNRTVRFAGPEGGLWSEPLQPGGGSFAQESGQKFNASPVFLKNAIWDDFKLMQPTPHGFTIVKRTNPRSAWVFSAAGKRAPGLTFVGDRGGGLAVSVKNFWQSFPASLEIRHASTPAAELVAWLWSPRRTRDGHASLRHACTRTRCLL